MREVEKSLSMLKKNVIAFQYKDFSPMCAVFLIQQITANNEKKFK